mmetsp:Transcript_35946/g.88455  ORF Transcript_35946/g.88455 Transcript_35946/m.88455 type:complete len:281 (+) Transcript_35946:121-963(+)|eukprot:CAMPEP_0206264752 /NCGR_PEP_ID=MMETSP0047_2-20121206/29590_1 /ASSEMBLY_ACC=CAM_ASM_000192 /TAXON_ID=195065 /ORGANISM="Chroomonas mesostigmatica_cf, Strain CCMP1168" /LENGTH=280 /DNA_ID=CAMNT_0053692523 /DNA_START=110 /DNA_END=952 /DNA_ORIENTATION=-
MEAPVPVPAEQVVVTKTHSRSPKDKLRPEFEALADVLRLITVKTDPLFTRVEKVMGATMPLIINRYTGVAALACFFPVMTVAVPFGLLCVTVGLPIFIPVLIISAVLALFNSLVLTLLVAISPYGRGKISQKMQPTVRDVVDNEVLYDLFYEGNPRPSALAVVNAAAPRDPNYQLILCLLIDFVGGNLSYLIPLLGESFDLVWAPVQMVLMGAMFDSVAPNAKWIGLAEEILPFTDIIPSASLTWLRCNSDRVPILSKANKIADSVTAIKSAEAEGVKAE